MPREISPPDHLCYTESSLFGGLRELRVQDGALICTACQGSEGQATSSIQPTPRVWEHLWQVFEDHGVWSWGGRYDNLEVMDGVSWALDVRWLGRVVEATGYHAWPGDGQSFERVFSLLRRLAHGERGGWLAGRVPPLPVARLAAPGR